MSPECRQMSLGFSKLSKTLLHIVSSDCSSLSFSLGKDKKKAVKLLHSTAFEFADFAEDISLFLLCHNGTSETLGIMALDLKQIEAVKLLINGHTHQEAADAIGISRRTISRWLREPEFVELRTSLYEQKKTVETEEFKKKKTALSNSLKRSNASFDEQLDSLGFEALNFLSNLIQDPDARNCDKLKAVSLLIEVSNWDYRYSQQRKLHKVLSFE